MEGGFLVFLGAFAVFFFGIVAYFLIMFFYPEWVGITGKTAIDAQRAHEGGEAQESEFWKKLDADIEPTKKDPKDS